MEHWYDHVPNQYKCYEGKVNPLWNQQVKADRAIPNNKPDITIHDYKKWSCLLIATALSGDKKCCEKESSSEF